MDASRPLPQLTGQRVALAIVASTPGTHHLMAIGSFSVAAQERNVPE